MAAKMKKTLTTFSMQYAHLSVDIQLYHTSCIHLLCNGATLTAGHRWCCTPEWCIRWCRFLGASVRWWRHHVWICCSPALAFGGVAGIITGKRTNELRACHLITTALLQDFFQSGAKTYQELSEYNEAVREHMLVRLWVDCLIKPSLLALRLLHAHRDGDFGWIIKSTWAWTRVSEQSQSLTEMVQWSVPIRRNA